MLPCPSVLRKKPLKALHGRPRSSFAGETRAPSENLVEFSDALLRPVDTFRPFTMKIYIILKQLNQKAEN